MPVIFTDLSNATTGADDATVGTVTWANTGNATFPDAAFATAATATSTTHYLKITGFNFQIPRTATINGIEVAILGKVSSGTGTWSNVRIVKNGTISSSTTAGATNAVTTTSSTDILGGSTSLWGETWIPDDLNLNTTGVVISITNGGAVTWSVDNVQMRVYYTPFPVRSLGRGEPIQRRQRKYRLEGKNKRGWKIVDEVGRFVGYTPTRDKAITLIRKPLSKL